jgi:hypothetical protein
MFTSLQNVILRQLGRAVAAQVSIQSFKKATSQLLIYPVVRLNAIGTHMTKAEVDYIIFCDQEPGSLVLKTLSSINAGG